MRRLALLLPVLLAGCASPFGQEPQPRDAREAACRTEATRVVQFRERGQTMRTDETESGTGTITVAPLSRAERDRGLAQMERDAMVRDCVRAAAPR
jgi:hypothetical protein